MSRDRPRWFLRDDLVPEDDKQSHKHSHMSTSTASLPVLHHFLIPARSFERSEGEAASGSVVEGHADAPQVHRGSVLLLMVFPQDSSLVHVGMLRRKQEDLTSGL